MSMNKKAILLVIDPQMDFCDPSGALYVQGAENDMARLGKMVSNNIKLIEAINVTLDSHSSVHIAHPIWWTNSQGEHPNPFTPISADEVNNGTWRATNPQFQQWSVDYMKSLDDNGRYGLFIWNPHCLIGSVGATVHPDLFGPLCEWEQTFKKVNYVPKGSNFMTEHYSAVKADVEVSGDPSTMLNTTLINALTTTDLDILIAGEALDFCIANTIRDIANEFSDDQVKRFVLLEDATSGVNLPDDSVGKQFVKDMVARGMRISKTTEYFG